MRPAPIASILDQIGRVSADGPVIRNEISPLRPRSVQNGQLAQQRPGSIVDLLRANLLEINGDGDPPKNPWVRKAPPAEIPKSEPAANPHDMAARLAEAYARGRAEGLAEARAEAEGRRSQELAAAREKALADRLEFELNEYGELESTIRSGFARLEESIGAAVARILAPFLTEAMTMRAVEELRRRIMRLCEGDESRPIVIRGPARLLRRLRERVADLPVDVCFVEDSGVEATVRADATEIATQLRAWAELLAPPEP